MTGEGSVKTKRYSERASEYLNGCLCNHKNYGAIPARPNYRVYISLRTLPDRANGYVGKELSLDGLQVGVQGRMATSHCLLASLSTHAHLSIHARQVITLLLPELNLKSVHFPRCNKA